MSPLLTTVASPSDQAYKRSWFIWDEDTAQPSPAQGTGIRLRCLFRSRLSLPRLRAVGGPVPKPATLVALVLPPPPACIQNTAPGSMPGGGLTAV